MGVEGLTFVITGAGRGIGAGTARLAASKGAKVMVSDIDADTGQAVVKEIESDGGRAAFQACDVTDQQQVSELMAATAKAFGGIDVLHNNAGTHETMVSADVTLETMTQETFRKIIDLNLVAPWICAKEALPYLKESSNASIVNAGSTGSWVGYPAGLAYGASKGGIALLTKNLAVALAPHGIRANCYCPAAVETKMVDDYMAAAPDPDALMKSLTSSHLVNRLGKPEDVAELVCFLASDQASFINGVVWLIDGGSLAWRGTVDVLGM